MIIPTLALSTSFFLSSLPLDFYFIESHSRVLLEESSSYCNSQVLYQIVSRLHATGGMGHHSGQVSIGRTGRRKWRVFVALKLSSWSIYSVTFTRMRAKQPCLVVAYISFCLPFSFKSCSLYRLISSNVLSEEIKMCRRSFCFSFSR